MHFSLDERSQQHFSEENLLTNAFRIGVYGPIYLSAGPGTIQIKKLKFMDYPVDEAVH